jgi:hypothetical protein
MTPFITNRSIAGDLRRCQVPKLNNQSVRGITHPPYAHRVHATPQHDWAHMRNQTADLSLFARQLTDENNGDHRTAQWRQHYQGDRSDRHAAKP